MKTEEIRNANQVVFWMLWHMYSNRRLLSEVRQELDRYVKVISPKSGLPIAESDRLDMDEKGIVGACPLLKASYFEAMRLYSHSMTYKTITSDFMVTESLEDATMAGKSKPRTYKLSKGEYVCVPHLVHQRDERYFKDPAAFNPERFYGNDQEKSHEITVDMGSMRPFAGGPTMCKGKRLHLIR